MADDAAVGERAVRRGQREQCDVARRRARVTARSAACRRSASARTTPPSGCRSCSASAPPRGCSTSAARSACVIESAVECSSSGTQSPCGVAIGSFEVVMSDAGEYPSSSAAAYTNGLNAEPAWRLRLRRAVEAALVEVAAADHARARHRSADPSPPARPADTRTRLPCRRLPRARRVRVAAALLDRRRAPFPRIFSAACCRSESSVV